MNVREKFENQFSLETLQKLKEDIVVSKLVLKRLLLKLFCCPTGTHGTARPKP